MIASRMAAALERRGPDDSGAWADPSSGIGLGFRRLSIVDLSPTGHQPMVSSSGRYVIVFNGEVYNFGDLRAELESGGLGPTFRGGSDTEVILAAVEAWGLEASVRRFIGMFALALWDRQERTLHLVRDRLGIKPLYYGWAGDTFLFGSELGALRAHPAFRHVAERGSQDQFQGSETEARERLEALLRDSVRLRMIADVPLGAFLSGGVDSSLVVALMQAQSSRPVRTFTIAFEDLRYNEGDYSRRVAEHLGTDHTQLRVTPQDAIGMIPRLASVFGEPFADSSQIPTLLVAQLARRSVTVSLSGDGGDELFGGYERYILAPHLWERMSRVPLWMRRILARTLGAFSQNRWTTALLGPALGGYGRSPLPDRLEKLAEFLPQESWPNLYRAMVSYWKSPEQIVRGATEPQTPFTDCSVARSLSAPLDYMMYLDSATWLTEDVLTKLDRASMAFSLEGRVPLLDHRVVEFAWRLPHTFKIREGQSKAMLREVLYQYVPRSLIERPKMGFSMPIAEWLRGPLREWADEMLNEGRLERSGYLNARPIRKKWDEHRAGKRDRQHQLWGVLMFQSWLEEVGL
ncbi:MAG: asparagine synthetase B [Chloroflexi bacterium]|nr:asparagine synthetase B [Chloroflexota bacterium]